MKTISKIIKWILLGILILVLLAVAVVFGFLKYNEYRNAHYYDHAVTGGDIEAKYSALGDFETSYIEFDADNALYGKFEIWYPTELESNQNTYPLVIMANGTGVKASQYQEVFRHLASWGFIVVGNEDDNSRTGASSAAALDFVLSLNNTDTSVFYNKVDTEKIGIGGHSQGGVGAINAVTRQSNGSYYKALYTASATSPYWGQDGIFGQEWSYDASKISIPCFMVAGTGPADAGTAIDITAGEGQGISSLWGMEETYAAIPDSVSKVMARQVNKDHGDMLRSADGYMTAWFMYWLQNDTQAGQAFIGEKAELLTNENWQDVQTNQ